MSDANSAQKQGVTPAKLVLIGVLALILCGVVYRNFFRNSVSSGGTTTRAKDDRAAGAGEADAEKKKQGTTSDADLDELARHAAQLRKKPWPVFSLAQVVAYDPFALPPAFPQPPTPAKVDDGARAPADNEADAARLRAEAEKARADAIAAIRAKGVQVVLKKGNEYFAVIDGDEIRVGDKVNGFEVVQIDASGVWLEEGTVQ